MFFPDELADLVQELWRQTPVNNTDITWSLISSLEGRNTLTNTVAWPPTVLADGTRLLARRDIALQSLHRSNDDQERSRSISLLINKEATERIH